VWLLDLVVRYCVNSIHQAGGCMYLAVFVLSIGFGVHTLQPATAVQPAQQYVSTDSTVNQLFDFFRAFFNQPDIDVKVKYLQEGIAVAEKNINRDIDLSRKMITRACPQFSLR
jgi:hypothetical protein